MPFLDEKYISGRNFEHGVKLPLKFSEYLELIDRIGRVFREDKKGKIADTCPEIRLRPCLVAIRRVSQIRF